MSQLEFGVWDGFQGHDMQVSEMAATANCRVVPHCFSTGINLAAFLHWMAATEQGDLTEYCLRPSPLLRHLVKELPPLIDGHAQVPQGPGLGIELNEDEIKKHPFEPELPQRVFHRDGSVGDW